MFKHGYGIVNRTELPPHPSWTWTRVLWYLDRPGYRPGIFAWGDSPVAYRILRELIYLLKSTTS